MLILSFLCVFIYVVFVFIEFFKMLVSMGKKLIMRF